MSRAGACLVAAALLLGCAAPAAPPAQRVQRYFERLGRDPLGTLPLLTERFHHEHALRVGTTHEAAAWRADRSSPPREADDHAHFPVDQHQLAWLAVQQREAFRRLAARFELEPLASEEYGVRALVRVRVRSGSLPAFEQSFRLRRSDPALPWRIDTIEQREVVPANLAAAFVAYPNEWTRRNLADALERAQE